MKYYIAYGSNLNVRQMKMRCPAAQVLGTSELQDYRLLFKGSKAGAYLTIKPEKGFSVPVAVWMVTPEDEEALDRYEGYPSVYYKKSMVLPVKVDHAGTVQRRRAFVYIMNEGMPLGIPTSYYLNVCAEGYRYFGFNESHLRSAVAYSKEKTAKRKRWEPYEGRQRDTDRCVSPPWENVHGTACPVEGGQRDAHLPRLWDSRSSGKLGYQCGGAGIHPGYHPSRQHRPAVG